MAFKPSPIKKRSVVIDGRKTSVSVEDEFWDGLKEMASDQRKTLGEAVAGLMTPDTSNLSSAIRLAVLGHIRGKVAA